MITQPIGRFVTRREWELDAPWRVRLFGEAWLSISPGFRTDGASVPRALWRVAGPRFAPDTFAAALCHDALYAGRLVERHNADTIFRRHLRELGVSSIKAWTYWFAVAQFGWIPWMRHTPEGIAAARKYARIEYSAAEDVWVGGAADMDTITCGTGRCREWWEEEP